MARRCEASSCKDTFVAEVRLLRCRLCQKVKQKFEPRLEKNVVGSIARPIDYLL